MTTKRSLPIAAITMLVLSIVEPARGSELIREAMPTELVSSPAEYAVLLPDGYDAEGERLPLLLLLHGAGSDREHLDRVRPQIEEMWQSGELPPMVVATPSVPPGTIYMDFRDGSAKWETFVTQELLAHLQSRYRIRSDREGTMVTGVSMGGSGSLRFAFRYPETFGAVAALEAGIWPALRWQDVAEEHRIRQPDRLAALFGDPFDEELWESSNPASIAAAAPSRLRDLAIYIECGEADAFGFHEGAEFLHQTLWRHRIQHQYRLVRWADHVGSSRFERSADRFRFLARYLAQPTPPEPDVEAFRERMAERDRGKGFAPFPFWPDEPRRVTETGQTSPDLRSLQQQADQILRERGVVRISDVGYAEIDGVDPERLSLDVYAREGLANAPVILYAHGGGWSRGSKAQALFKPGVLVPAGYLFVSMNYRFRPEAELREMGLDVATAAMWLKRNAKKYGGDPERIVLMGHSAGAHLVSAVGTDESYLEQAGGSLSDLRGVISLDTAMYNVPLQMEGSGGIQKEAFGTDPAVWLEVSPWHHIEADKGIPAFLLFISDGRREASTQPIPFTERLKAAGVDAAWHEIAGKGHSPLDLMIGTEGDETTRLISEFLARHAPTTSTK